MPSELLLRPYFGYSGTRKEVERDQGTRGDRDREKREIE